MNPGAVCVLYPLISVASDYPQSRFIEAIDYAFSPALSTKVRKTACRNVSPLNTTPKQTYSKAPTIEVCVTNIHERPL